MAPLLMASRPSCRYTQQFSTTQMQLSRGAVNSQLKWLSLVFEKLSNFLSYA